MLCNLKQRRREKPKMHIPRIICKGSMIFKMRTHNNILLKHNRWRSSIANWMVRERSFCVKIYFSGLLFAQRALHQIVITTLYVISMIQLAKNFYPQIPNFNSSLNVSNSSLNFSLIRKNASLLIYWLKIF